MFVNNHIAHNAKRKTLSIEQKGGFMGMRMAQNCKDVDLEKLSNIDMPEMISILEALGAVGTFSWWDEKDVRNFLIEVIDPKHEHLNHLHSECPQFLA